MSLICFCFFPVIVFQNAPRPPEGFRGSRENRHLRFLFSCIFDWYEHKEFVWIVLCKPWCDELGKDGFLNGHAQIVRIWFIIHSNRKRVFVHLKALLSVNEIVSRQKVPQSHIHEIQLRCKTQKTITGYTSHTMSCTTVPSKRLDQK